MEESPTPLAARDSGDDSRLGAMPTPRNLWLLLNARAVADAQVRAAVREIRELGHTVEVCPIWEPKQAIRLARLAAESGADVVVAAGGDGTVNEALNGLQAAGRDEVALGILPFGTANDFARAAQLLDCRAQDLLLYIAQSEPVPIDVARVNDRLFLNVASGGLSAEITTDTPQLFKEMLGRLAYSLIGLQKLFRPTPRPVTIRTPDWEWRGNMLFFAVGNSRFAGGGFQPAPRAVLDDGLLDLGLVPDVPPDEFPQMVSELFILGNPDSQYARYRQAPSIELECPEGLQVNADGEPLYDTRFCFDLLPRQRPVFVMRGAPLAHSVPSGMCSPRAR